MTVLMKMVCLLFFLRKTEIWTLCSSIVWIFYSCTGNRRSRFSLVQCGIKLVSLIVALLAGLARHSIVVLKYSKIYIFEKLLIFMNLESNGRKELKVLAALLLNLYLMCTEKRQAAHNKWVAFSIIFVSINREMVSAIARAVPFHALSAWVEKGHLIYGDVYTISH